MEADRERFMKSQAAEVLYQLERISNAAKAKLNDDRMVGSGALASINTLTSGSTIKSLDKISQENRESYLALTMEPAIARVLVADDRGEERIYYICRTSPLSGISNLASYRAPVGRLASLGIGAEFKLPNGPVVEVLERSHFRPSIMRDGWDSRPTIVETETVGPITIESLRALLTEVAGEAIAEDLLGQLLAEESKKANIIDGVRRSVITKMGLRDQPILDQYQDEIFRLPLDNRLLLLGPPGTGKTTTLIRRLGQKLDTAILDETEQRLIEIVGENQELPHENSWLMFTPTELLKQYLKEAFAREGVPASDLRIRTWHDFRRELGKNSFGILRSAAGSGSFVLKAEIQSLNEEALDLPTEWFGDFNAWQINAFLQELREAAAFLKQGNTPDVQSLGERLSTILAQAGSGSLAATFETLAAEVPQVQALVVSLRDASERKIRESLNLQLNRNRGFLDELARFLDGLQQTQTTDADDPEDFDAEEEEDATTPRTGRGAALAAYMQAVRAQARSHASKRSLGKTSRHGKIIEWIGDRTLTEADLNGVGANLLLQSSARRFVNPVKRCLDGVPKRYRSFRRHRQEEGVWYLKDGYEARDIHPLELDLIILAVLRSAGELISRPNILRNVDSPPWSSLKPILELYRNQILVDEVTDFSPIQLACMAALAHPRLRSFFACGDFNQRLTTWGACSPEDLKWVYPDFDIREITVSYRQSRQLNDLARAMISAVHGTEQTVSLPTQVDNEGVAPALLEAATVEQVVKWLADRIREIEIFVGQLPSTAIFVNGEAEVTPIADALNAALVEHNIQVIACQEGRAVGQESNVRVFDIQHIKGLEFEVVFFVGIDRLASLHPRLFDKYLYVGTTRAATYLGLTCTDQLPAPIDTLRHMFISDWSTPIVG